MARKRSATEIIRSLETEPVQRALEASHEAGSMSNFYKLVRMRNPSRSYYIRDGGRLHSLKAVLTHAAQAARPGTIARDFHAADGAQRLIELEFDVVHNPANVDEEREREWISRLSRKGQPEFRYRLIDLYGKCALSDCTTLAALEAAHVRAVSGKGSDRARNGILLRADLHKLFDSNLLAINPNNGRVHIAESCRADYLDLVQRPPFEPPAAGPRLADFAERWLAFTRQPRRLL